MDVVGAYISAGSRNDGLRRGRRGPRDTPCKSTAPCNNQCAFISCAHLVLPFSFVIRLTNEEASHVVVQNDIITRIQHDVVEIPTVFFESEGH
jgi:hypothetical protein